MLVGPVGGVYFPCALERTESELCPESGKNSGKPPAQRQPAVKRIGLGVKRIGLGAGVLG